MAKITIDGKEIEVEDGMTLIQACEIAGVEIPRFCYHEKLKIAGNCRMCLVELERAPKPVASCAVSAADGMVVRTNTETVKKAREGVMEFLLINHPLDCPICDQGGECDLQDQAYKYGRGANRFSENKRAVKDKYMGPLIQTHMTRCIHCTRCVRFMTDLAGVEELGAVGRGEHTEITSYLEKGIKSELSGNIIDICPVGALNSKPYAYTARKWELSSTKSIDIFDSMGSNIVVDSRGLEVMRILPDLNEEINEEWISDRIRFSYDGLKTQRIDKPYKKSAGRLSGASWEEVTALLANKIVDTDPSKIGAICGDLTDCETIFASKLLLDKLGSKNYDFNQHNYIFDTSNRGNYLFNSSFAGLEEADLVLLVGANIRKNASVLGARLGRLARFNDLQIFRIGEGEDQTFPITDIGVDISLLEEILEESHEFSTLLKNATKPAIIIGDAVYSRKDSLEIMGIIQKISEKYGVIKEEWNGFNLLHNHASTIGALELGFYPENSKNSAVNMAKKLESGDIELLFLFGADDIIIPREHKGLVVYIGHHGDRNANIADIVLPTAAFTEKNGTYVNNEGKIQYIRQAVPAPGKAMADAEIILKLADYADIDLGFYDLDNLRMSMMTRLKDFSPHKESVGIKLAAGKALKGNLKKLESNFYHSNVISRASKIMAACIAEFEEGDAKS